MSRRSRIVVVVLAVIVVLAVAVRLALDPLATWGTRRALAGLHGMRGTFTTASVTLHDLSYEIHGLRIEKTSPGGNMVPYFEARSIRLALIGRELLHRRLAVTADLDAPRLEVVQVAKPPPTPPPPQPPTARKALFHAPSFVLEHLQIRSGQVRWADATEASSPGIVFRGIEATLDNFASRPELTRGEPTVVAARGTLEHTGQVSFFATADPLAKLLTFAGQGRVQGLQLRELSGLVAAKSGVAPDKGTLDMTFRFQAVDGQLTGGIRPVLKDAGTHPAKSGLGAKLKSLLADATLHIFKNDVPGQQAVATTIPIQGRVDDPNLQFLPTVLGIVRNAFVQGVSTSLRGLPPPQAKEQQGAVEQARRALTPGRGNQPQAQPQGKGH